MRDDKEMSAAPPRDAAPAETLRDENGSIRHEFVEQVADAVARKDVAGLRALAGTLHEADAGDVLEALDPDLRTQFIELLGPDFDFTALTQVDDTVREEILEELPPETVAEGVRELDSDDAVYILEDLPRSEQEEILEQMPPVERGAVERSLDYPENSAGRRMQTEFIAVPPSWTVGHAIDYMRETADLPDRFYQIYAVDPHYILLGAVSLDRLLRAKRPVLVTDLMDADIRRVRATDDQEEVARLFERYDLVAAPVVDASNRLIGIVTHDDVIDVIEEEAEEEVKALGGVSRYEELSTSVLSVARGRFTWLLTNLATAILAAWVISWFEGSLQKMVSLAILMPIVSDMGGNAGTQAMTVAVRALATRELDRSMTWRVIRREAMVGLLNGIAFAVIMGVVAAAWFHIVDLGYVIGLAMIVVLVAAAVGGILIPLVLERLSIDPAVASGPFVTTVTDVIGFFSFLGIATLWFGLR